MFLRIFLLLIFSIYNCYSYAQDLQEMYKDVAVAVIAGDYRKAIYISKSAVEVAKQSKGEMSREHHIALSSLAYVYNLKGDHNDAITQLELAYGITKRLYDENHYQLLEVAFRLAETYARAGKVKKSNELVKQYGQAIEDIQRITRLDALAEETSNRNMFSETEKLTLEEIILAKKYFRNNHNATITPTLRLAHAYHNRGMYDKAEQLFIEAIAGYESMYPEDDRPYYEATMEHLALLYQEKGRYEEAEKLMLKSQSVQIRAGKKNTLSYTASLNTLSSLYKITGKYSEAEAVLNEALVIIKNIAGPQSEEYATTLMYQADIYAHTGRLGKAQVRAYESWSVMMKQKGNDEQKVTAINNLATIYAKLGDYNAASAFFNQGIKLISSGDEELYDEAALLFTNLGALGLEAANYPLADSAYNKAIALQAEMGMKEHPEHARLLVQLSLVKLKQQDIHAARRLLVEAENVFIKSGTIDNFGNVAFHTAYAFVEEAQNNFSKASQHLQRAESIITRHVGKDHPDYGNAMINQGLLYGRMKDPELTEQYMMAGAKIFLQHTQKNILFLAEAEKSKLLDRNAGYGDAMLSVLQQQQTKRPAYVRATFDYVLHIKGMALFDASKALAAARKSNNPELMKALDSWQKGRALVARYYLDGDKKELVDSLNAAINTNAAFINQHSAELRITGNNTSASAVWKNLKPNEAAIEFVHYDYYRGQINTDSVRYGAFIITKKDSVPVFISLCSEAQLQKLLRYTKGDSVVHYTGNLYRGVSLIAKNKTFMGDSLYRLVWQPLEASLQGSTTVYVAASGLLNRVAFKALPTAKEKYLSDKYSIRQYFSLRQMQTGNEKIMYMKAVLYGGIDYGNAERKTTYNYLPGTLREVETIHKLFQSNSSGVRSELKIGVGATEEHFKSLSGNAPDVVHLSTHGYYYGTDNIITDPMLRCGLILADANLRKTEEDNQGFLTGFEIAQLDLSQSKLAVLSACETALGDIKGSEGVYGLQRAFKIAGVEKLVISLWQVPDKETSELMALFYQGLMVGKPAYISLSEAQKELRKKYAPYYWAAFVLLE